MSKLTVSGTGLRVNSLRGNTSAPWVRNPSWPACEANSGDNRVRGLYAVWPSGGNFISMLNSGNYTVDYGDGTTTDYSAATQANYEYDYNSSTLDGTNAPVTLTAATNTINRTAHGYTNGMEVKFYNITTTTGIEKAQPYYVANATADTFQITRKRYNTISVLPQDTTGNGIFFKPDGLKMYMVGATGDRVYEYNLSVAWDASTATFLQSFSIATEELTAQDIFFKPDGLKMYVLGSTGTDINEYNLSTAWNVSTATYVQVFSVSSRDTNPTGLFFNPDGLKMYFVGTNSDNVNEYNLSTAWNISTATFVQAKSILPQDTNSSSVHFKPDGLKMYILGFTGDKVYEYNLSSAWNVSTATYSQSISVLPETTANGMFFHPDGITMYVNGIVNDCVVGYTLSTAWNISTATLSVENPIVDFTNDGSATLLPYKIATVTVTPQGGSNLTSINLGVKHTQSGLVSGYATGWLDMAIAGANITTLTIANSSSLTLHTYLERAQLNQLGAVTSFASLFLNCRTLQNVIISDTITTVTNMSSMFNSCSSLTSVPLFNTAAVTNMINMFNAASSLTSVPLFNTAAVTDMGGMFASCSLLTSVPLFNTAAVTTMASMFSSCNSLNLVPLFNTAAVTSMSSIFAGCSSLTTVPLFNTAAVTNMSGMFSGCNSLIAVPLFNTISVTTMANMFAFCYPLRSVPLFNTISVTTMSAMFNTCYSLTTVPLFNTASVTDMANMFSNCRSLTSVPLFNTAAVTSTNSMFLSCSALISVPLFNTAGVLNTAQMFSGCSSLTSVPLFNISAVTGMSGMFTNCASLNSVPLFNTSAAQVMSNMFSSCTALTAIPALVVTAVTSSANIGSMFASCVSLARIEAKNFNFTFSVASSKLSATALNEIYTNLPTVVGQTITVTGNYGVASDDPTIATAKGWTVTG
jgi:surface protein